MSPILIAFYHAAALSSTLYFLCWGLFACPSFKVEYLFQLTFITQKGMLVYYSWTLLQDLSFIFSQDDYSSYQYGTYALLQVILPVALFISFWYWLLRLGSPGSMNYSVDGFKFPLIVSIYNHGINACLCILEFMLLEQVVILSFLQKFAALFVCSFCYIGLLIMCVLVTGQHVYPFLAKWNTAKLVSFYFIFLGVIVLLERATTLIIQTPEIDSYAPYLNDASL
jgi:hypothetical protein